MNELIKLGRMKDRCDDQALRRRRTACAKRGQLRATRPRRVCLIYNENETPRLARSINFRTVRQVSTMPGRGLASIALALALLTSICLAGARRIAMVAGCALAPIS